MKHRSNLFRRAHSVVFAASREGRSSEIALWSNGLACLGLAVAVYLQTHSWPFTVCLPTIAFVVLRGALAHRLTLWIAAACGTLAVAGVGGGLAWLFAHVLEVAWAPSVAAILGAATAGLLPASAYSQLAHRRVERRERDSLIDPVSVPSSH